MPTSYGIDTNSIVENLVETNNIESLEIYLDGTHKDQLYHILSSAVDVSNTKVLQHFISRLICKIRPDGNSYDLLVLAVENYVRYKDTPTKTKQLEIIELLCEQQKRVKTEIIDLDFSTRYLIKYLNENDDYELLDMLVTYGANLWNVYHYSIAWNHPKVFDKILDKYLDLIDFEWTESAIDIAYQFDHNDIVTHVLDKIKVKFPKKYERLKHLDKSTSYIIKCSNERDSIVIPSHILDIKTSFDFNKTIDNIKFPSHLVRIDFGPKFNQVLDNVLFPDTVEEITFGINNNWSFFDQSIKNIKFPKLLKRFYNTGSGCNESIDDVIFPNSLEILSLGYKFNQPIDKVKWSQSLKKITFGCDFNQSLENVKFPESLDTLEFYQTYTSLAINTINHPIKTLKLICIHEDIKKLPQSLKYVSFHSDEDKKHICELPSGCETNEPF